MLCTQHTLSSFLPHPQYWTAAKCKLTTSLPKINDKQVIVGKEFLKHNMKLLRLIFDAIALILRGYLLNLNCLLPLC